MENYKLKKIALTSYVCLAFLILVYVVWRSFSVGFTHDECLSYNTITGDDGQMFTANNHWLNSIAMYLSSRVFGFSEFALRLPNVIAFGFYLYFVYRIFSITCKNPWSLIIAAPLFVFNPFMLDFFGLARGYGLGMAFFTAAIYYFIVYFQHRQSIKPLIMIVACSICCVYSNYAFLTAVLAIHGTALVYHFKVHRAQWAQLLLFYILEAVLLIPAVLNILFLSEKNELYVGGESNVFRDTLKSILNFSFSFGEDKYNTTLAAIILLIACFAVSLFFRKSKILNFIKILIFFMLAIPTVLHFGIGMLYPKDRAAIYWMIVIGFLVMFATEAILNRERNTFASTVVLLPLILFTFLQFVNFIPNFNTTHTIIWQYDSDVKNALQLIRQKNGKKPMSIGASWLVEPPLNYYRKTENLNWIRPVTKEGVTARYDFYLVFKEDFPTLKDRKMQTVKYFPNSEIYLMQEKK